MIILILQFAFDQNQQMHSPQPLSTKQMMDKSVAFRLCFWGAIACMTAAIVLGSIAPFMRCSNNGCSGSYSHTCATSSTLYYCCTAYYNTCGDNYCYLQYSHRIPCFGILIPLWVVSGLCIVLFIIVIVMFCNFRKRYRNPLFNPQLNSLQYMGGYYQPVQFIPQPQQPQFQPQQYYPPPIYPQPGYYQAPAKDESTTPSYQ